MASTSSSTWLPPFDARAVLHRNETHLQARLQTLLDAQAEGLLAGLISHAPQHDGSSSGGTATPTSTVHSYFERPPAASQFTVPVSQPKTRKIGLRGARKGLSRTITELAILKNEETRILEEEFDKRERALSTIHGFSHKQEALRTEIQRIQGEDTNLRSEALKREEKQLGNEIHDLETRLYEMKAKHRLLKARVEETDNGLQARLSSYQRSLELSRREVTSFLARPPPGLEDNGTQRRKGNLWALPSDRRTLEMAEEHYKTEEEAIRDQIGDIEQEREALEAGAETWESALREIGVVEDSLRTETDSLQKSESRGRMDNGLGREAGMRTILSKMATAKMELDKHMALAEGKKWNLLVCAIGAEVEALNEGYDVLERAYQQAAKNDEGIAQVDESSKTEMITEPKPPANQGNGQGELLRLEEEDEGPAPDLLFSQQDE